jgi:hypothetical protein
MSQRWLFIGLMCLAWSWASSVNFVNAQAIAKPAKTDRLVRVTYPVADLIVPIPGYPCSDKKETLEVTLIQVLTNTIARESWSQAGGAGTIAYFPFGMAIVVNQRQDVHAEIARLLTELRRAQDVQVSIDMRAVHVSPSMAKHLLLEMDEHGKPVRAIKDAGKDSAQRFTSMDDKQIAALLKLAQSDESGTVTKVPKLTMFNGQQGRLSCTRSEADTSKTEIVDGFQYDVLSVLDPEKKFVRLTLSLEHYTPKGDARPRVTKATGTFVMAPGRTLVWHLGVATEPRHLFVLATPCVVGEKERRVVVGELGPMPGGAAEEQSAPAPKTANTTPLSSPRIGETKTPTGQTRLRDPKERAIEYRLRQPINLNFKNVPLKQALNDLAVISGVPAVPDKRAMQDAKINLDSPVTFSVENISMKSALDLMLKDLRLTHTIENQVLLITTEDKTKRQLVRVTYSVADLIGVGPDNPLPDVLNIQKGIERSMTPTCMCTQGKANKDRRATEAMAEILSELIQNTVSKDTWERVGGPGNIQYYPFEKQFVVNQCNEVHKEIASLLATLRRMHDVSVDVETRFVHMSANTAKQWCKTLAQSAKNLDQLPKSGALACIDEGRVFMLLEAAQGDQTATITQYPKLTLLNNQAGECRQPNSTGWSAVFHPVVSPDRRSLQLKVNLEHRAWDEAKSIERITKAAKTTVLSNGRTLVWDLGETTGRQQLFVLVTPRIRVREDERIILGEDAPISGR